MNNSAQKPRLLVADDEIDLSEIIQTVAEGLGFEVACVTDGAAVVEMVEKFKPNVITLDLRMPGASAVEILRELGSKNCKANIMLMSGMDQQTLLSVQAIGEENNLKIALTLSKPISIKALESSLTPFLGNK